jgi:hypothetical protein
VQELIAGAGKLPGCVLTFDALHTVHETFEMTVVGNQADYLVCVKGNAADLRRTGRSSHARALRKPRIAPETTHARLPIALADPAIQAWAVS